MDEQTLELQIKSKSQEAVVSLNKVISLLTGVEKTVGNIDKTLNNGTIKTTVTNINQLKSSTDKATTSANKLGKALSLGGAYLGVKRLTKQMLGWMDNAVDFTEQLNLFNVVFDNVEKNGTTAFSKIGKEATQFQYKLNEAFGTNKTQTFYMQGIFQSMGENVGIGDTYSAIMSETMTKLTYDLASLYNKSENTVAEAIRAGVYAGQTKPLRAFGVDVTQMSMQPIADSLGLNTQVKNLSQAEKEILRYLATLKQAQVAMGDFANTVESPANQLKIFKQQLAETKVAISSLFIGTFSSILPYANAFLMVIKEISKAIATMFGIKLKDYNTGIASQEGIYDGIADSVDNATNSVKEFRRQTLGFDEIHNINENKDTGSGVTGGTIGGIDQRLLDAITGYDNGMESVRMKAIDIRDKIMEWLGFTKKINPLTGEVSFEYQGINKTLKNIWTSFKGLNTQGKILVGLGLVVGATKLWNAGKKLVNVFGNSGLGKTTKNLLSPTTSLLKNMKEYIKYSPSLSSGINTAISDWSSQLSIMDKFKTTLVGIAGLGISLQVTSSSIASMQENGTKLSNVLTSIAGGLGSVASGALIGATYLGPLGAVIGSVGGALSSLIPAFETNNKFLESLKGNTEKYILSLNELRDSTIANVNASTIQLERTKELSHELEGLMDSKGKVNKADEERVNFILTQLNSAYGTEYKLIDGIITLNGKQVETYNEIEKAVDKMFQTKKAELMLQAMEQEYIEVLKQRKEIQDEISKETERSERLQNTYNGVMKAGGRIGKTSQEDVQKAIDRTKQKIEELKGAQEQTQDQMIEYEKLYEAKVSGNYDEFYRLADKYFGETRRNLDSLKTNVDSKSKSISNSLNSTFNSLNGKTCTFNLKANTDGATKSLNEFGNKLNNGGFGSLWTGIRFTPAYADGGMPEDGLFFANHSELVGKFSNGRTAVANNEMIIEGIKAGVYEAVVMAMSQHGNGQSNEIDVHVHTDEGTVVDRVEQRIKQTGTFPWTIPTH